jgi:hypothetical protein
MKRQVDDDDVALAIELGQLCEIFNCLPGPGGILDQDPYLLKLVKMYLSASAERQNLEVKSGSRSK